MNWTLRPGWAAAAKADNEHVDEVRPRNCRERRDKPLSPEKVGRLSPDWRRIGQVKDCRQFFDSYITSKPQTIAGNTETALEKPTLLRLLRHIEIFQSFT
jgi:hypothetical protein